MKYRTFDVEVTSLSTGTVLVYSRRSGAARVMSRNQFPLLFSCRSFETLEDHAKAFCVASKQKELHRLSDSKAQPLSKRLLGWAAKNMLKEGVVASRSEIEGIADQLSTFISSGFLISEDELKNEVLDTCSSKSKVRPEPTVSVIGVPTRNRTATLQRAITSYATNNVDHERRARFTVIDNAQAIGEESVTDKSLFEVCKDKDLGDIRVIDKSRRAEFAQLLSNYADLPYEITYFALLGDDRCRASYGACRNALLLDSVGEMSVQVDDDTICKVGTISGSQQAISLTSKPSPYDLYFYPSREAALDSVAYLDASILSLHERWLGRELSEIIAESDHRLDVNHINPDFLDRLRNHNAHIGVVFFGTVGDSGMHSNIPALFLDDLSFERSTSSEAAYEMSLATRHQMKISSRPVISDGEYCMTINIGLDNRNLLPPFMPVQRNEDGVFGAVLKTCFSDVFFCHLPYAVIHDPPHPRNTSRAALFQSLETLRLNDLIIILIQAYRKQKAGITDRTMSMYELGQYLTALSSYADSEFMHFVRGVVASEISTRIKFAEARLDDRGGIPAYWANDVVMCMSVYQDALTKNEFYVPSDLDGTTIDRISLFKELVSKYGKLLTVWETMVSATKALRSSGTEIAARPISTQ